MSKEIRDFQARDWVMWFSRGKMYEGLIILVIGKNKFDKGYCLNTLIDKYFTSWNDFKELYRPTFRSYTLAGEGKSFIIGGKEGPRGGKGKAYHVTDESKLMLVRAADSKI